MVRDHSDRVQILSLANGYSVLQASYERLKDRSCWRCRSRENMVGFSSKGALRHFARLLQFNEGTF